MKLSSGLALDVNFNFVDSIISPYRNGADRTVQDYFSITAVVFPLCLPKEIKNSINFAHPADFLCVPLRKMYAFHNFPPPVDFPLCFPNENVDNSKIPRLPRIFLCVPLRKMLAFRRFRPPAVFPLRFPEVNVGLSKKSRLRWIFLLRFPKDNNHICKVCLRLRDFNILMIP